MISDQSSQRHGGLRNPPPFPSRDNASQTEMETEFADWKLMVLAWHTVAQIPKNQQGVAVLFALRGAAKKNRIAGAGG